MNLNNKKVVGLKNNKSLIVNAISLIDINEENYYMLGNKIRNNFDVVKHLIELNGAHLSRLDNKFKDNEEICLIAIENYPHAFQFASSRLRASRHFVIKAIEKVEKPVFMKYLNVELKKDQNIVLTLINKNMYELADVDMHMLQNETFITKLLDLDFASKYGTECLWIYEHLISMNQSKPIIHLINLKYNSIKSKLFQNNAPITKNNEKAKKIIIENEKRKQLILEDSIKQSELEKNIDFKKLEEELKQKRMSLSLDSKVLNNKEFARKMIVKHSNFYQFISDELKKDKQIAKIAILADPINLLFSPTEINENEAFIFEMAKIDIDVFNFASEEIKSNKEFILNFIKETQNHEIVKYISSKLKNDGNFLLDLVKTNRACEKYFTKDMIELKNKTISENQKANQQTKRFNILDTYKEIEEYDKLHKNQ